MIFRQIASIFQLNGGEIFQQETVDKGHQENRQRDSQSSRETGYLWMDRESSYSECDYRKDGKCGLCSQGPGFLKWQSVVIRGPYRVFEKSESRGDFLEREIAP